jgi:hypothetical protein
VKLSYALIKYVSRYKNVLGRATQPVATLIGLKTYLPLKDLWNIYMAPTAKKKAVPYLTLLFPALSFLYPNSRPYLIRLSRYPN